MSTRTKTNINSACAGPEGIDCTGLKRSFNWYSNILLPLLKSASQEFLCREFEFYLQGISYEPNPLWKDCDYFVTQSSLTKKHQSLLKISDSGVKLILDDLFGEDDKSKFFDIRKLTDLEAQIISGYSKFALKELEKAFKDKKKLEKKYSQVTEYNIIYFSIYVKSMESDEEAARIILSLPEFAFIEPELINYPEPLDAVDIMQFSSGYTYATVFVGKTKVCLEDISLLEFDDVVILENSNIHTMSIVGDEGIVFGVNPDPRIVIDIDDEEGGEPMDNKGSQMKNIWDSLQVDVNAEFQKIKMSLGDLRQITEGLVVDIAPIINNQITLHVEGKDVANGELVIVGDKYGVRITHVFEQAKYHEPEPEQIEEDPDIYDSEHEEVSEISEDEEDDDSDFDYGDFELEDDI